MATAADQLGRATSERDFQDTFIEWAQAQGWRCIHIRPARGVGKKGEVIWRTPVQGDGKGFPDNLCLRGDRQVVSELKKVGEEPDADQDRWLKGFAKIAGSEVYVWTPADWPEIKRVMA